MGKSTVFTWAGKSGDVEASKGVKRSVIASGEKVMICLYDKEPGVVSPEHSHHNELIGLLIKGRQEAVINGEKVILEPGMGYYIAGGEPHGPFVAIGEENAITLDIIAPPRTIEWRSDKKIE